VVNIEADLLWAEVLVDDEADDDGQMLGDKVIATFLQAVGQEVAISRQDGLDLQKLI
jgi:hypothetical protein